MINIVTAENRRLFHHALMEMHRQRKAVFIDRLGWPLSAQAGVEIDDYDAEDVVYLIEAEGPRAPVSGSVRLLPTTRPHLLGEVFAHLCARGLPSGPRVWEATRFCPAPHLPSGSARAAMLGRMIAAIMETALIFGIETVTYVADPALAPMAERAGWRVAPLGPAQGKGRSKLRAFAAEIDAAGLRQVRQRHAIEGPLTRYAPADLARAA